MYNWFGNERTVYITDGMIYNRLTGVKLFRQPPEERSKVRKLKNTNCDSGIFMMIQAEPGFAA